MQLHVSKFLFFLACEQNSVKKTTFLNTKKKIFNKCKNLGKMLMKIVSRLYEENLYFENWKRLPLSSKSTLIVSVRLRYKHNQPV